jgi:hypothetical protein
MDLISLKYWHWIVLGFIAGGMLGYAWTGFDPQMPRSGDLQDFRYHTGSVGLAEAVKDLPRITNVKRLAPDLDPQGKTIYPITYDRLGTNKDGKAVYQEQGLYITEPFHDGKSFEAFMGERKVPFADRAGPMKYVPVGYGMAVGIIGIGLIWPTMIRLLVGAGFAAPKPPKPEKKYASGDQDDGTIKPKKRLGFSFAGGARTPDPFAAKPVVDTTSDADVSKLFTSTGKPAEELVAAPAAAEEKKDYGGEYYPVARPHHHHEQKPH